MMKIVCQDYKVESTKAKTKTTADVEVVEVEEFDSKRTEIEEINNKLSQQDNVSTTISKQSNLNKEGKERTTMLEDDHKVECTASQKV